MKSSFEISLPRTAARSSTVANAITVCFHGDGSSGGAAAPPPAPPPFPPVVRGAPLGALSADGGASRSRSSFLRRAARARARAPQTSARGRRRRRALARLAPPPPLLLALVRAATDDDESAGTRARPRPASRRAFLSSRLSRRSPPTCAAAARARARDGGGERAVGDDARRASRDFFRGAASSASAAADCLRPARAPRRAGRSLVCVSRPAAPRPPPRARRSPRPSGGACARAADVGPTASARAPLRLRLQRHALLRSVPRATGAPRPAHRNASAPAARFSGCVSARTRSARAARPRAPRAASASCAGRLLLVTHRRVGVRLVLGAQPRRGSACGALCRVRFWATFDHLPRRRVGRMGDCVLTVFFEGTSLTALFDDDSNITTQLGVFFGLVLAPRTSRIRSPHRTTVVGLVQDGFRRLRRGVRRVRHARAVGLSSQCAAVEARVRELLAQGRGHRRAACAALG